MHINWLTLILRILNILLGWIDSKILHMSMSWMISINPCNGGSHDANYCWWKWGSHLNLIWLDLDRSKKRPTGVLSDMSSLQSYYPPMMSSWVRDHVIFLLTIASQKMVKARVMALGLSFQHRMCYSVRISKSARKTSDETVRHTRFADSDKYRNGETERGHMRNIMTFSTVVSIESFVEEGGAWVTAYKV